MESSALSSSSGTHSAERERWNRKYRERSPGAFRHDPSEWLIHHAALLDGAPRGRALDVACGNGRDARYLAGLGFTVDALDISDVAVDWLRGEARQRGLAVDARCCDLASHELPERTYRVVVNFNFLDRRLFPAMKEALMPGGLLFFETFTRDHVEVLGRKMPVEFTLEPGELRRAFAELEILDGREFVRDAGDPDRARALASLVARRPHA